MVRQPHVLILDEATSALDPTNEKVVQAALDQLVATTGATSLMIAHRLTTVKDCDRILVLHDGRLVESGTHTELLEIPVTRLPKRGREVQGQLSSGFYAAQWASMMGGTAKKDAPDAKKVQAELDEARAELAQLRVEKDRAVAAADTARGVARAALTPLPKLASFEAPSSSEGTPPPTYLAAPPPPTSLFRHHSAPFHRLGRKGFQWLPSDTGSGSDTEDDLVSS